MKRLHLLRVAEGPEIFSALWEALEAVGLRAGWLEVAEPDPAPATLVRAAFGGALRAVAVGERSTLAVKRRRGPARLEDLLREHFLGCRLVLLRGDGLLAAETAGLPTLVPVSGGGWRVEAPGGPACDLATEELVARLRRPRPWQPAR